MEGECDDNRFDRPPGLRSPGGIDGQLPSEGESVDAHVRSAWRSWLSALATDSEAAMAAALAYESLPDAGRDAWLDALASDAPTLGVPAVALYAPLLAVEASEERRARIQRELAAVPDAGPDGVCGVDARSTAGERGGPRALRGVACDGTHACVLVAPLYLDFVQVLSCRYTPGGGFVGAHHDPMRHSGELGLIRDVEGVAVEPTPLRVVIEELAHAILADKRGQRSPPEALASFAHLFVPHLDDGGDCA